MHPKTENETEDSMDSEEEDEDISSYYDNISLPDDDHFDVGCFDVLADFESLCIKPSYSDTRMPNNLDELDVGTGDGEPVIEGPWIDPSDNPMLKDLALESILHYIDGKELKACRLVSKQWNVLTLPLARSRLRVTIWGNDSNNSEQRRGIMNFVKLIESNTLGIPFGRFRLGSFDTTTGPGQRFLELCGSIAKEFWLDYAANHLVENVSALLKSAPELVSFVMPMDMRSRSGDVVRLFPGQGKVEKPQLTFLKSLDVSGEFPQNRKKICPTFYKELLESAEQISTLSLTTYKGTNFELHGEEVLETLETLGKTSKIENLRIVEVTAKHLDILERIAKKLRLKKLDLMVTRSVEVLNWFKVVKLFKNTLTCLHMSFSSMTYPTSFSFPRMPNLKELKLEIHDSHHEQHPLECENQNLSTTFPILEELHIFSFALLQNVFEVFTTSEQDCVVKTMKSLILQHGITVGMESLNHILSIFPNLTTLECQVNTYDGVEVIQKIWSHMTQLEGLNISGCLPASVNLDSLVTGIQVQDLRGMAEIFESIEEKSRTVNFRQEIISRHSITSRPSIQSLTALRSLNLCLNGEESTNYLTDLTGYLGFYSLKNLRHLSVHHSQISKTCSEILVKDKELMSWRFKSVSDQEIIPSNWKYANEY